MIYLPTTIAYILCSVLAMFLPGGSNLEYEYSFYLAMLTVLVLPIMALFLPIHYAPMRQGRYRPFLALDSLYVLCFLPVIMLLPGWLWQLSGWGQCSTTGYMFWFFVQVYPNLILAHAIFHGVLLARSKAVPRLYIILGYSAAVMMILMIAFGAIFFSPQKRTVALILGFLHGPIYDEWIAVDFGVILARIMHAMLASAALILVRDDQNYRRYVSSGIAVFLAVICAWASSQYPSVGHGQRRLDAHFNRQISNRLLSLHYVGAQRQGKTPDDVLRLFREASFHLQDVALTLGVEIPKTKIYLYPDTDSKKIWFGAGDTDVTDVRGPSVHITSDGWPHPSLRHELVHAVSAQLRWLGFNPNMAITEGIAVALDPQDRQLDLDAGVATMIYSNRMPRLETLFGLTFWIESGQRAYTVAGSLMRYLNRRYGPEALVSLFQGKGFKQATGKADAEIFSEWQAQVLSSFPRDQAELVARSSYRRQGTLSELCPHTRIDFARARSEGLLVRLRQPLAWSPEKDYWPWLTRLAPEDESLRYRYWRSEIDPLARRRQPERSVLKKWADLIAEKRAWPPQSIEDIRLAVLQSDLEWVLDQPQASVEILQRIERLSQEQFVGDSLMRQVEARQVISRELNGDTALMWRKYLAGWSPMPLSVGFDDPWVLKYLRLRNANYDIGVGSELKRMFAEVLPEGHSISFYQEWYRVLGRRYFMAEVYDFADRSFAKAAELSQGDRQAYFELLSRQSRAFAKAQKKKT